MKKIFIINGKRNLKHSKGNLNQYCVDTMIEFLKQHHKEVQTTTIEDGYTPAEEIEKYLWADVVIYQNPIWWMSFPFTTKQYIDGVFTPPMMYSHDGRTPENPTRNYGKGGKLMGKHYMFSVTLNAPKEAFTYPEEFFEGKGIEVLLFSYHKANQYIGLSPLPTFMMNDVMKNPKIEENIKNLKSHLTQHLNLS